MNIEIKPTTEDDYPVVQNLIRFYVYDMSEAMGWDCPESGLFGGCDDQPHYWGRTPEPAYRWPGGWRGYGFLVRIDGRLAGFSLVKQISEAPPTYDMGEFFVLRKFRRQGVGRYVASAMFDRFIGDWEVRELPKNHTAIVFWRKVISGYTNGNYEETQAHFPVYKDDFLVQRFRTRTEGKRVQSPSEGPTSASSGNE